MSQDRDPIQDNRDDFFMFALELLAAAAVIAAVFGSIVRWLV